jgi:hypothetical protein
LPHGAEGTFGEIVAQVVAGGGAVRRGERAARRAGAMFSITVVANTAIRAAIATISQDAWVAVRYPGAVHDRRYR